MTTWKKECYEGWCMTPSQVENATQKITIKGLRLTKAEKDTCFYMLHTYPEEYSLKDNTMKNCILKSREEEQNWKQNEGKQIREFVKEWRRLGRKYHSFDYEDKTLDELVEMWTHNYFCLYFLDSYLDCIMYSGGKKYAQYYCYNVGLCPEKEVTLWRK